MVLDIEMKTDAPGGVKLVGAVLSVVLSAMILGWPVMLLIGIGWHEFGWLKPIGYGPSIGIGFVLDTGYRILRSLRRRRE